MFSIIGRMLDKTYVNFNEKDRHQELKKQYNRALSKIGLTFIVLLFIILSSMFIWYKGLRPTPAKFYLIPQSSEQQSSEQSSQNPNAKPVIKVSELKTSLSPRMSSSRVQSWTRRSLIELQTMDFLTYNDVLKQSEVVFRKETYEKYIKQMNKKDGLIPEVKDKSLIMSLTPLTEVRIIQRGETPSGFRVWRMQMIGLLVRTGSIEGGSVNEKIRFDLLVEEVPTTQSPYGLVISQYETALAP